MAGRNGCCYFRFPLPPFEGAPLGAAPATLSSRINDSSARRLFTLVRRLQLSRCVLLQLASKYVEHIKALSLSFWARIDDANKTK